jgi:hypothetical protein
VPWPELTDLASWLRLPTGSPDEPVAQACLNASITWCDSKTGYQWPHAALESTWTTPLPEPVFQACVMLASRLYRRRDSVDGTLGFGDLGVIRIGRFDSDIEAQLAPWAPLVFG